MNATLTLEQQVIKSIVRRARAAAHRLGTLPDKIRRDALNTAADALLSRKAEILSANVLDTRAAMDLVQQHRLSSASIARLKTTEQTILDMVLRVRTVAALPDPIGSVLEATELDRGLRLYRVSCPIGVIAVVFESRPDVIPQIASLTLRAGNVVIFKGGREAAHTNWVLNRIWCDALAEFPEIPPNTVNLLKTRDEVAALLDLEEGIDLVIPRGSKEFVRHISSKTRFPVLGHGEGVCHVYVDRSANLAKALDIAFDSKVQYPAACNSMETLLVHRDVATTFLPDIVNRFLAANVEMRGCTETIALIADKEIVLASEEDWSTEYSELIVSIRIVDNDTQAIEHIQRYGSGHTEAIVTEDHHVAQRFTDSIDAAGVYVNASTRFADGYRYGMGAELGISTGKLHARGPVGLQGLTSYKYKLFGDGHTVASYTSGERQFKHRRL